MHLTAHLYSITERGSPSMNTHDDDLRIRLGSIRNRGARYKRLFAEVRSRSSERRVHWRPISKSLEVQPLVLRPDASSSSRASCVPAGRGQQGPQRKRDGVTRTGETAHMFAREIALADERAFAELSMLPASTAALAGFASIEWIPSSVNRRRHVAASGPRFGDANRRASRTTPLA
jgi:hypothetical protein